jgi:hypothetical protein
MVEERRKAAEEEGKEVDWRRESMRRGGDGQYVEILSQKGQRWSLRRIMDITEQATLWGLQHLTYGSAEANAKLAMRSVCNTCSLGSIPATRPYPGCL